MKIADINMHSNGVNLALACQVLFHIMPEMSTPFLYDNNTTDIKR